MLISYTFPEGILSCPTGLRTRTFIDVRPVSNSTAPDVSAGCDASRQRRAEEVLPITRAIGVLDFSKRIGGSLSLS